MVEYTFHTRYARCLARCRFVEFKNRSSSPINHPSLTGYIFFVQLQKTRSNQLVEYFVIRLLLKRKSRVNVLLTITSLVTVTVKVDDRR